MLTADPYAILSERPDQAWTWYRPPKEESPHPFTSQTVTGLSQRQLSLAVTYEDFWATTNAETFVPGHDKRGWEDYAKLAAVQPETAVAAITEDVRRHLVSERDATAWLFDCLVSSRSRNESPFYKGLLRMAQPSDIASVAFAQYRQLGFEGRLSLAASLLGDLGHRSWPVLRDLARRAEPECEYFVSVVANAKGVPSSERIAALADMARSRDPDVLWSVMNVVQSYPELRDVRILLRLSECEDDELSSEATALLASPPTSLDRGFPLSS